MDNPLVVMGAILVVGAILSGVLKLAKQSYIVAFIITGIIAGLFKGSLGISQHDIEFLSELGIILLLFIAGMEIELSAFKKRWKLLLSFGLAQILLNTIIGVFLAKYVVDLQGTMQILFFGICITLSSTIVVLSYLKSSNQIDTLHGQIILGLMLLQDILAVLALAMLDNIASGTSLAISAVTIFVKLFALTASVFIIFKLFLNKVFRFFARSRELIFIASLAWVLGVAAAAHLAGISPELAAFIAGIAISILPYKLEIQANMEPLKDFGIILFFVSLGYQLNFNVELTSLIIPTVITSLVVLLGTPLLILFIGYIVKTKSRPSFYIGLIINQISEFSLILAALCYMSGIFTEKAFMVLTFSTIITVILSTTGHQYINKFYKLCKIPLTYIERLLHRKNPLMKENIELSNHVVIISYNSLADTMIKYFLSIDKTVILITLDPDELTVVQNSFKDTLCVYADAYDPDTWEDLRFNHAYVVVSCIIGGLNTELGILDWLKTRESTTSFIAATDDRPEALELYNAGALFVMHTEDLAAERVSEILESYGKDIHTLEQSGIVAKELLLAESKKEIMGYL
ncbi:MAG: cation:proton antiporter [Candidatus Sabulitectum sp.]|nr:cation:proton antiporter [Candidatus Sabulitectum sp.]